MEILIAIAIAVLLSVIISTAITIKLIEYIGKKCIEFASEGDLKIMDIIKEILEKL